MYNNNGIDILIYFNIEYQKTVWMLYLLTYIIINADIANLDLRLLSSFIALLSCRVVNWQYDLGLNIIWPNKS